MFNLFESFGFDELVGRSSLAIQRLYLALGLFEFFMPFVDFGERSESALLRGKSTLLQGDPLLLITTLLADVALAVRSAVHQ
jgi:hypothetical protein